MLRCENVRVKHEQFREQFWIRKKENFVNISESARNKVLREQFQIYEKENVIILNFPEGTLNAKIEKRMYLSVLSISDSMWDTSDTSHMFVELHF